MLTLSQKPPDYVTKDGMWAAVPFSGTKYVIINEGKQVHVANNFDNAMSYIKKQVSLTRKSKSKAKLNFDHD